MPDARGRAGAPDEGRGGDGGDVPRRARRVLAVDDVAGSSIEMYWLPSPSSSGAAGVRGDANSSICDALRNS